MERTEKNYIKFSLALIFCLLVRLIPLRAPNVEPIMSATMPMSKAYGAFSGFFFAVLSILIYDIVTGTLGKQTFFTAPVYGLVGFWAGRYFSNKKGTASDYVRFAVIGTLFYDAMTGFTVGPLFYEQPLIAAFWGQLPFTALHLVSNVAFAYILSPEIYKYLIRKRNEEQVAVETINKLKPKII